MARPINTNAADTKRRILDVAVVEFAQHGFAATSVRNLATAAKVNAAMISHYFVSKQVLHDSAVDEVYRRLRARAAEILGGTTFANIDLLFEKLYAIARAERDGVRLLVRQVLDQGRLSEHAEAKHFLPEIEKATRMTADLLGVAPAQARTAAVAIGYLLSRYVIQDDRSLVTAFGVRSVKEAHARVVATLATTARALFSAPPATKE